MKNSASILSNLVLAADAAGSLLERVERAKLPTLAEHQTKTVTEIRSIVDAAAAALAAVDAAEPQVARYREELDAARADIATHDATFRRALAAEELDIKVAELAQTAVRRADLRKCWAEGHVARLESETRSDCERALSRWTSFSARAATPAQSFVADLVKHKEAGGESSNGLHSRADWRFQPVTFVAGAHGERMRDPAEVVITATLLSEELPECVTAFVAFSGEALIRRAEDEERQRRRAAVNERAAVRP